MANTPTKIAKSFRWVITLSVLFASITLGGSLTNNVANAASCTALPTTYGQSVNTVNVATAGTYTVWARVKTPTSAVNSVWLQIDQSLCSVKMGGVSLTANSWTWIQYRDGSIGSVVTTALAAGSHTITLAGTGMGLQVDEVMFTQNCTPTGLGGTNCTNPPVVITTPVPVVTLSVTPTSLTTGSGATVTWSATNSPTSCTASGDWSGAKGSSGTYSTGALTSARTYTYSLVCANGTGSGPAKSVTVVATAPITYLNADVNKDRIVNVQDFSLFRTDYGKTTSAAANKRSDVNGDGNVNILDFSILAQQFNKTS